jgi:hypothetical protein
MTLGVLSARVKTPSVIIVLEVAMRAVHFDRFGGPELLRFVEIDTPVRP